MGVNKVNYGGRKVLDISDTTATAADVAAGKYFYNADGDKTAGTNSGGGESNYVHGEFNTGSAAGAVITINIPYSGSGYPIAAMVYVKGGVYDSSNTDWYTVVQRYAVGEWVMTKAIQGTAPTYATSGNTNQGVTAGIYKNSSSSANSYSRNSAMNTNSYTSSDATGALPTCVRFKSATRMSVYVASTSYGLMADLDYEYHIVYSE